MIENVDEINIFQGVNLAGEGVNVSNRVSLYNFP